MSYVYPRLDLPVATQLLIDLSAEPISTLRSVSGLSHPRTTWYPTGTNRVETNHLADLQNLVRGIAAVHGYPDSPPGRGSHLTAFDRAVAGPMWEHMQIVPADAAHDGVWSFLSLVLLPDVGLWRFPNPSLRSDYERLLGRPRNVFRRLWWRTQCLGPEISSRLTEDEAVGIMERTSIGFNPRVARSLAVAHLAVVESDGSLSRTELLRQTAKRLRRIAVVTVLNALDDQQLGQLLAEVVGLSAEALRKPGAEVWQDHHRAGQTSHIGT